jgi:hypothetical protein
MGCQHYTINLPLRQKSSSGFSAILKNQQKTQRRRKGERPYISGAYLSDCYGQCGMSLFASWTALYQANSSLSLK